MTTPAPIWWRDDDAGEDCAELQRLLDIKRRWDIPLSLAVVPEKANESLTSLIHGNDIDVLVHGLAHRNHSGVNEKKAEFHPYRDIAVMRQELTIAHAKMRKLWPKTLPVFVPPWNRFPSSLMGELREAGFSGFSAWGDEDNWPDAPGLVKCNAHIDLIDWRHGGKPKPLETLTGELSELLRLPNGTTRGSIGVLTHHLQMSGEAYDLLEKLFRFVSISQSFFWTRARSIFLPER